jgi:hypothetical protein
MIVRSMVYSFPWRPVLLSQRAGQALHCQPSRLVLLGVNRGGVVVALILLLLLVPTLWRVEWKVRKSAISH